MTITVQQLVDNARVRHAATMRVPFPDGGLLLFLNGYQRRKLLELSDAIEPLLSESRQVATVIAGALVGSDGGVPYYITTSGDGWPVLSDAGVPYVDFTQPPIALDPFGLTGSTPGFPLPAEFIKLISVTAASSNSASIPVDVVRERSRITAPVRTLSVFINGNRLVPIRQGIAPFSDKWTSVTSVTLSYIAMQTLAALTDVVRLPLQLVDLLEAALAERLAMACPATEMPAAVLARLSADRVAAEAAVRSAADQILEEVTSSYVQFNR